MTSDDNLQKVKSLIEKLLRLLGVDGSVEVEERGGRTVFNISTPDSQILIGQHGANLKSLQHIVRIMARKQSAEQSESKESDFFLDVDGYRKNREEFLQAIASQAAERVRQTRERLVLKPMSSADRRVIHSFFTEQTDVMSESVGEEPERRVVIRLRE